MLFTTVAPGPSIVFGGTQHVGVLDLGAVLHPGTHIPQQLDRSHRRQEQQGPHGDSPFVMGVHRLRGILVSCCLGELGNSVLGDLETKLHL